MRRTGAVVALCALPSNAFAHSGAHGPHDLLQAWTFEPIVLACLGLAAVLYLLGCRRLARRGQRDRLLPRWRRWMFAGGLASLVVALVSPIDALGELLFAGHMVQHLLLTMVAAPLLVVSDAGTVFLWSLPRRGRRAVGRVLRANVVNAVWRSVSRPVSAWSLHAFALLVWHIPRFYELAIVDDRVHALEHWSFLGTALLYWWAVLAPRPRQRLAFGPAVVYLFTAATTSGILGAMISMANEAWYGVHARWTPAWGLTPLEDQQLAGLIMWVPAAIIYLAAVVPMAVRALSEKPLATVVVGSR